MLLLFLQALIQVEYEQYIRLKKNKMQEKEEMQKMKKDIDEIKSLLREILNANN